MGMTQIRWLPLMAVLCGLSLAQPRLAVADDAFQAPETILATAEDFLTQAAQARHQGRIAVEMGHLDPRLRLTHCMQPLQAFQPSGARTSGRTSVGVRCPGPSTWTIYVPADIAVFGKAVVSTRALPRGAALTPGDAELIETDLSTLGHGYLESLADIDGMVTRRPVTAGTVLTPAMVKAPHLIQRGDRVRLVSGDGPIQVEMLGEAINNGARGDRVRVRALNSQRVVEGWVVSASVVKVTL